MIEKGCGGRGGTYAEAAMEPREAEERRGQRGDEEKGEAVATPEDLNRGRGSRYTSPCAPSEERMTSKDVVAEWFAGAYSSSVTEYPKSAIKKALTVHLHVVSEPGQRPDGESKETGAMV